MQPSDSRSGVFTWQRLPVNIFSSGWISSSAAAALTMRVSQGLCLICSFLDEEIKGLWNRSGDAPLFQLWFSIGNIFIPKHFKHGMIMTGSKMLCFLVPVKCCWLFLFLPLAGNIIYQGFVETKGQLGWGVEAVWDETSKTCSTEL